VDLDYLRGLLSYWADGFDWRERERELNRHTHRIAEVDGVRIHFVHRHGTGLVPLVLTHGWPSTFVELLPLADRLHDRFDLVIPSLPGYAFSQRPPHTGVDRAYVARLWHRLMQGLGYRGYGAHGGGFGAGVATHMALLQPNRMIGVHPGHRPSATRSTTPLPGWPPGCWTSGGRGRTAAATAVAHFAASEEPDLLAGDITDLFTDLQ
jgi:pimeloyl-ACP methyl ester carboxylesterase